MVVKYFEKLSAMKYNLVIGGGGLGGILAKGKRKREGFQMH